MTETQTDVAQAPATRACSFCGEPATERARFCSNCGIRLSETPEPGAVAGPVGATAEGGSFLRRLAGPLLAASFPVVAMAVLVLFKPSAVTTPDLYFIYALIQAVVFLLLIRFLDLYEREPLSLLALMALWGGTVAGSLSIVGNDAVDAMLARDVGVVFGAALSAPLIEEAAKGAALVVAFGLSWWANRRFGFLEFEGPTDGIVYGAAVGLGFAYAEDIFYFFRYLDEGVESGLQVFLERVDFFGPGMLVHPLCTAAFGAGLGLATWTRSTVARVGFPVLGFLVAVLMHAVWNGFAQLVLVLRYGWDTTVSALSGEAVEPGLVDRIDRTYERASDILDILLLLAVVGLVVGMALWLLAQRDIIRRELAEEVERGLLTPDELELMPSYVRRANQYWGLLKHGRFEQWRQLRRIHNELVDLAFMKWRRGAFGCAPEKIHDRRRRIANLRAQLPLTV